jgi:hypothetical protein
MNSPKKSSIYRDICYHTQLSESKALIAGSLCRDREFANIVVYTDPVLQKVIWLPFSLNLLKTSRNIAGYRLGWFVGNLARPRQGLDQGTAARGIDQGIRRHYKDKSVKLRQLGLRRFDHACGAVFFNPKQRNHRKAFRGGLRPERIGISKALTHFFRLTDQPSIKLETNRTRSRDGR